MRALGRQFRAKVANRGLNVVPGTSERPQGQFFSDKPYHDPAAPMRAYNDRYDLARSVERKWQEHEAAQPGYQSWNRRNALYIVRQETLFDPGNYGRPEEDDRTTRTRQDLFKVRWGE